MEPALTEGLLRAFGLTVLERREHGMFVPVSEIPDWFPPVSRDGTFPFLGNFLEEAAGFWEGTSAGDSRIRSGLCVAADDEGHELFHFEAWAVKTGHRCLLVFERSDDEARELRETLQRAREDKLALAASQKSARDAVQTLHELSRETRTTLGSIATLVSAADEVPGGSGQKQIFEAIRVAAATLSARVDDLVGK
jgi:signal transduction histidine kinase